MTTLHFNWTALKENSPEEQYTIVQQTVTMLDEKAQMEFMHSPEFTEWLNSAEMDEFLNTRRRWHQTEGD
jgi:hypothetical protein